MSFNRLLLVIFSILLWIFFVLSSTILMIIACIIWLVTVIPDKRLYVLHALSCFWGSLYIWVCPLWQVKITGKENIRKGVTYIIISNHQSMIDIPVLYSLFIHYKFVSKAENFRVPFVGWLMILNNYPKIKRGDRKSKLLLFRKVSILVSKGSSIMMFPEGTRHPGGYLGPFRDGAFIMALNNRLPILPIVMDGSARALPKKGFVLPGKATIRVSILPEIPIGPFEGKKAVDLMKHARQIMEAEYARLMAYAGETTEPHN
jgi:1-acyl-sn-glycerol-3-phosphate acyltransferase